MKKLLLILGLPIVIIALPIGWQLAAIYLDNIDLRDDLKGVAAQSGVNTASILSNYGL